MAEDTFTPSTQNGSDQPAAQEVGLFQFAPGTLTAIQIGSTGQTAVGAPAIAGTAQAAATTKTGTTGIPGQSATESPAAQSAASAASATSIQLQIRSLNASLPASA